METRCFKIKLNGSIDRVRHWARTVKLRADEAFETLRDETVVIESVFLDRAAEGDFLIVFMKAESFKKSGEAIQCSTHAIDEYHRQFKSDTWAERSELELLVDLDRMSEA